MKKHIDVASLIDLKDDLYIQRDIPIASGAFLPDIAWGTDTIRFMVRWNDTSNVDYTRSLQASDDHQRPIDVWWDTTPDKIVVAVPRRTDYIRLHIPVKSLQNGTA